MNIQKHVWDMQNAINTAQRAQAVGLGLHYDRVNGKDRWALRDGSYILKYSTSNFENLRAWISGFKAARG